MSEHYKTIAKGALIIFAGMLISKIFTYLYRILLARGLGPEAYGIFSICFAIVACLSTVALLGFPSALERFIPIYYKNKSNLKGIINFTLALSGVVSILLGILLFIFAKEVATFFGNAGITDVIGIFAIVVPILTILSLGYSISKAFKNALYLTLTSNIIYPSANLILAAVLVYMGYGITSIAISFVAANLLTLIVLFVLIHKKLFSFTQKIKRISMSSTILVYSLPLMFTGLFGFILTWTDTIMLGILSTETTVGLYNAAFPTAMLLYMIPVMITSLFLPVVSELLAKKKFEDVSRTFKIVSYWIMTFNFPILLFFVVSSKILLGLLFGETYTQASTAFIILSIGFFIYSIFMPTLRMLELYKRTKFIFVITFISAILNLILDIVWIPTYGMAGAALASTISLTLMSILALIKIRLIGKIHLFSLEMFKSVFVTLLIFIPLYWVYHYMLGSSLMNFIIISVVFGICYSVVMYRFVLTDIDKDIVKRVLLRLKNVKSGVSK